RRPLSFGDWQPIGSEALSIPLPASGPFASAADPVRLEFRAECGVSELTGEGEREAVALRLGDSASAIALSDEGSALWTDGSVVRVFQNGACFATCADDAAACQTRCTREVGPGVAPAIADDGAWLAYREADEVVLVRRRDRAEFRFAASGNAGPALTRSDATRRLFYANGASLALVEWSEDAEPPAAPTSERALPCADVMLSPSAGGVGVQTNCDGVAFAFLTDAGELIDLPELSCDPDPSGFPVLTREDRFVAHATCALNGDERSDARIVLADGEPRSWETLQLADALVGASTDREVLAFITSDSGRLTLGADAVDTPADALSLSPNARFAAYNDEGLQLLDLGARR
ncbi:MAG: hypothetical protein AAF645_15550, partial [Myxococcota bacterium]